GRRHEVRMRAMLENDIALVTGASRGIGKAVALALAHEGARVIGTSTTPEGAGSFGRELASRGYNGRGMPLDVSSASSIAALLAELEQASEMPTILVNNAAITRDMLLLRMKDEDWRHVLETNLTAVFRLSKAVLRRMMRERRGRIINITSVVALTGNPGQANYSAAKAGMLGFTKSLAREIAAQIPLARLGTAEDVAAAVLFLASPQAGYITGETLHVNGGMYMP